MGKVIIKAWSIYFYIQYFSDWDIVSEIRFFQKMLTSANFNNSKSFNKHYLQYIPNFS